MAKISEKVRREVCKRDKYRCRECGIQVVRRPGLRAHLHHIIPKSAGGEDTKDNLITLCEICHITKYGHLHMFRDRKKDIHPQYVKWALWDIGLNLACYSERIDPRSFPAKEVSNTINKAKEALGAVISNCEDCKTSGNLGDYPSLEEVVEGIRIAHESHNVQQTLDRILHEQWKGKRK